MQSNELDEETLRIRKQSEDERAKNKREILMIMRRIEDEVDEMSPADIIRNIGELEIILHADIHNYNDKTRKILIQRKNLILDKIVNKIRSSNGSPEQIINRFDNIEGIHEFDPLDELDELEDIKLSYQIGGTDDNKFHLTEELSKIIDNDHHFGSQSGGHQKKWNNIHVINFSQTGCPYVTEYKNEWNTIKKKLEKLSKQHGNIEWSVLDMNEDVNGKKVFEYASKIGVRGTPSIVIFVNDKPNIINRDYKSIINFVEDNLEQ